MPQFKFLRPTKMKMMKLSVKNRQESYWDHPNVTGPIMGLLFAFILLFVKPDQSYSADEMIAQFGETILSTNWVISAKAALPSRYFTKGDLGFQEMTNLICLESQRGNNAATGLWGWVLITQSHSQGDATNALELLRYSAEKGYVPAMFNLGLLFKGGGHHIRKDYGEAIHWFGLAADRGDSQAMAQLGACFHYGLGTNQDYSKAAPYYRRASELTNYEAMNSLGYLLMSGYGVAKDGQEAKHWLTRAAKEGGNRRAMLNLGALCSQNFSDTNSLIEAFQWYEQSAFLGDPLACLALCECYFHGWGTKTNLDDSHFWRLKAAKLGATKAQYYMGSAYRTGDGVPKDMDSALMWYGKAAAKNHPGALYDLALLNREDKTNHTAISVANQYMLRAAQGGHRAAQFQYAMSCFGGDVAPPDFESGKQWLAKAAENAWAQAEFSLFQLYYHCVAPGPGLPSYPKDAIEAVKWLRRAAGHGNPQAKSTLAVMLIQGRDMEKNKAEAEKLLRDAAQHGYAQAQNDLGFAILDGETDTRDLVEAAMWFRLAQSRATDSSLRRRLEVNLYKASSQLTPDEMREVDHRVKNFQPLPVAEIDPMVNDWEKNHDYQREDGRLNY